MTQIRHLNSISISLIPRTRLGGYLGVSDLFFFSFVSFSFRLDLLRSTLEFALLTFGWLTLLLTRGFASIPRYRGLFDFHLLPSIQGISTYPYSE